jgi:hypothetical protein
LNTFGPWEIPFAPERSRYGCETEQKQGFQLSHRCNFLARRESNNQMQQFGALLLAAGLDGGNSIISRFPTGHQISVCRSCAHRASAINSNFFFQPS